MYMVVRKRRTTRRRQRGGLNIKDLFKKGHAYVKSNKLASRGLSSLGYNKAAKIASILGYGKRKRRVPRRQRGGFFAGALLGSVAKGLAQKGLQAVRDHKLASKALAATGNNNAAGVASMLGFGRRRRVRRRMRGGAWYNSLWNTVKSVAKPVYNFVRDNQLASKALGAAGYAPAAAVAGTLGFGRRRVVRRKPARRPARRIQGGAMRAGSNIVNPYILIR